MLMRMFAASNMIFPCSIKRASEPLSANSRGVPTWSTPSSSSQRRSATCKACSISWVERRMVLLSLWANWRNSCIMLTLLGKSRKAVGSSRNITGVCCANAFAIIVFCRSPSLSVWMSRDFSGVMPTMAMASLTIWQSASCK